MDAHRCPNHCYRDGHTNPNRSTDARCCRDESMRDSGCQSCCRTDFCWSYPNRKACADAVHLLSSKPSHDPDASEDVFRDDDPDAKDDDDRDAIPTKGPSPMTAPSSTKDPIRDTKDYPSPMRCRTKGHSPNRSSTTAPMYNDRGYRTDSMR